MGKLHICGFQIPVARDSGELESGQLGEPPRAIDGSPAGGIFYDVEGGSYATPRISLTEALAIQNLCRGANGSRWSCDNTVYSSSGLAMIDTPTFQSGTKKFGSEAIQIASGGGAGDIEVATVITSTVTAYTVAGWCKDGAGDWTHYILRSDGAKWVDAVRNDSATLPFSVPASVWILDQDASNTRYFDDLVWLPFLIWDDWGADWPQSEVFASLPDLKVWGDLIGPHEYTARARVRVANAGQAHVEGTTQDSAFATVTITGGRRSARA